MGQHEDKAIIDAQQQVIDRDPERAMVLTSMDGGPTSFRRIVRQRAARQG